MFARKNTRAGTGLRAAPARPIHWRYNESKYERE
jgi:hypothetical protein